MFVASSVWFVSWFDCHSGFVDSLDLFLSVLFVGLDVSTTEPSSSRTPTVLQYCSFFTGKLLTTARLRLYCYYYLVVVAVVLVQMDTGLYGCNHKLIPSKNQNISLPVSSVPSSRTVRCASWTHPHQQPRRHPQEEP